ncbi:MAG TPA: hypothetical protein VGO04_23275 [Ensifer sp.]|jgi:hypothetical protein|uniref:hypothetical protein n=1 Tax=Ensifer sp. TaxID=1872086 RepID=UPI002E152AAF|nr:hypothetical protein [Ensifer sp.]
MADVETLKIVGEVAGIGGLALGVFLLLFREIIRKKIFPRLPADEAYKLLLLITIAVWSTAIVGVGAWVYTTTIQTALATDIEAECAVVVGGNVSSSTISNSSNCPTK